ncbi:MAG: thiamine pyrophosphate-binding protein [Alphaproteobacteria bacterium]|nr:thiamine pyrophosphate-binding protein [Alphaproteobacteria bacterium]MDP6872432.1 thiamine pyrophosphate-binding protein [Alphaproteobacteria bacterium]
MTRMTGGQALVKSIIAHGVDTIFGLPGVQLDWFFNALHDEGNNIQVINSRHEQGVAYMAHGYAQSTGKVGAFAVVPGPGVLNTAGALSTSWAANVPVLCVTGQIPSASIGRGYGQLHEIPDQLSILRGLSKSAARIEHPTDAPGKMAEAFRQLRTGRPRPVAVEMPLDQLAATCNVDLLDAVRDYARPPVDEDAVAQATKLLAGAKAPMIFVGSGAMDSGEAVEALAEMLQAPVIANRTGRGGVSNRNYLSMMQLEGHRLWPQADVVLAVGSRLQPARMNWGTDDDLKIIHVDIDPVEIKRIAAPDVAIVGDARDIVPALVNAVATQAPSRASREEEMLEVRSQVRAMLLDRLGPQMSWIKVIREALDDDGIFVDELTQVGYVSRVAMPVYRPRGYLTSAYQGTLGCGLATAIGAKIANPDRQVLSINGDGGFMYNVQELATAVKYNVNIVAIVFADGAFGNVRRMQEELYDGRTIASDLTNPDFVAMAESFGCAAYRAETPDDLAKVLPTAFKQSVPAVIEVPFPKTPDPWPIIIPGRNRPAK